VRRAIAITAVVLLTVIYLEDIGTHRGCFANSVQQATSSSQPSATPSPHPAVFPVPVASQNLIHAESHTNQMRQRS
jgi:hypothetical protein